MSVDDVTSMGAMCAGGYDGPDRGDLLDEFTGMGGCARDVAFMGVEREIRRFDCVAGLDDRRGR